MPTPPRPRWLSDDMVRGLRWGLVLVWALAFAHEIHANGFPYYRSDLLLWLVIGLAAASFGKRNPLTIIVDFLPFAAVLVVYDYLRGFADSMGMPTWWTPQIDIDKFLFFGHEPTVWLQEHLKYPTVQWWEVPVALCYVSFFFLPYVTAAVLWLRGRADFYRWALRFVALSFVAFVFFALTPAAPPWAAARCLPSDVASHPYNPPCLSYPSEPLTGNLLGPYSHGRAGAAQYVENGLIGRALDQAHLHFAAQVIAEGRVRADAVAAVPSLHAGGIMLFSLFMWKRLNRWWRPLLVFYPVFMVFSLAFLAEHYVADALAGWLAAIAVHLAANRIERWHRTGHWTRQRAPADILDTPNPTAVETSCPPTQTLPETTPSSI